MVLTVYKLNASPPARAVLMTIRALNIPGVNYVDINILEGEHLKEEYAKVNPHKTIPAIKDGDFLIWDSHAIATYLVNRYRDDDSLYPLDPKKRAVIDQRLHFDTGNLFPTCSGAVGQVMFQGAKKFSDDTLKKIESAYESTEKLFTSPWLAGDTVTVADICCVSSISTMNIVLPIDKLKYPKVWAWLQRCSELDFYRETNEPGLKQLSAMIKAKLE